MSGPSKRRVHIDRLVLDLRGVSPDVARAAAKALGPELTRALAGRQVSSHATARIDAGRVTTGKAPSAQQLASSVAQRIAQNVSSGESKGRRS